LATLVNTLV